MSNMSYCRFENTLNDVRDCHGALQDLFYGDEEPLSQRELNAAKSLVHEMADTLMTIATCSGVELKIDTDFLITALVEGNTCHDDES